MVEPHEERRKAPRYVAAESSVEFSESGGLLSLFKRSGPHEAEVENMGSQGLCMRAPVELKPDRLVSLKTTSPLVDGAGETVGRVIWCRRVPRTNLYQVGLEFHERELRFRKWIGEFEEKAGDLPVPVRCPHCQKVFKVKQWLIGQSAKCSTCKQVIQPIERAGEGSPLRSVENVLEAMDDMEGADVGAVKASLLHPRIQHFLMKYISSSTHLGLVEYIHGRDGTKVDLKEVGRKLGRREPDLREVCEDFAALDILKKVNDVYIYNPDMVARRDVNDFMRDYSDAETKTKVLAFVLTASKEKPD